MEFHIGIDPGKGGGIAVLDEDGIIQCAVHMPATERDILDVLSRWKPAHAMLELVHSSPQMGVKSSWTFGVGYGILRMALFACAIPFDEVGPGRWQAAMGCRTKGDKNVTKRRAQELFSNVKVTHAIADALLLAEYGRRTQAAWRKTTRIA